jgi:hypothetical protein
MINITSHLEAMQVGRRYRLRDRTNQEESIEDCIAVYGGSEINGDYRSYTVRNAETGIVSCVDTAGIAIGEPEIIEDLGSVSEQKND